MANILDDLAAAGFLTKRDIDQINTEAGLATLKFRTDKASELIDYYVDDDPKPAARQDDPPPVKREAAPTTDLSALTSTLAEINKKLGNVITKDEFEAEVQKRGDELVNRMRGQILSEADELNHIHRRNEKEFGEELDSEAFKAWANERMAAGHNFAGYQTADGKPIGPVTRAWQEYTASKREEVTVENKVRERLKTRNAENQGKQVPGVTPPGSRAPISIFMNRDKQADANGNNAVDRAGAALAARLGDHASEA